MSHTMQTLVARARIGNPSAKAVLMVYADAAGDDGTNAYPGNPFIAFKTELSKPRVKALKAELTKAGWLIPVEPARGGLDASREYHLNIAKLTASGEAAWADFCAEHRRYDGKKNWRKERYRGQHHSKPLGCRGQHLLDLETVSQNSEMVLETTPDGIASDTHNLQNLRSEPSRASASGPEVSSVNGSGSSSDGLSDENGVAGSTPGRTGATDRIVVERPQDVLDRVREHALRKLGDTWVTSWLDDAEAEPVTIKGKDGMRLVLPSPLHKQRVVNELGKLPLRALGVLEFGVGIGART